MEEWLPTEKASPANIGGHGSSHRAKVETTAVASGSTTEQAGPHNVLPPATIAPTIQEAQRPSLSEIAALLAEMRVLLRHVLHRQNQNVHLPGTTQHDVQAASPLENVHVELLTR